MSDNNEIEYSKELSTELKTKYNGRPKIAIDYKLVEKLAQEGNSQEAISQILGISRRTFCYRKDEETELEEAWKRGKAKCTQFVVSKLMEKINEGDSKMIQFYLETQGGWTKTTQINLDANINDSGEHTELKDKLMRKISERVIDVEYKETKDE